MAVSSQSAQQSEIISNPRATQPVSKATFYIHFKYSKSKKQKVQVLIFINKNNNKTNKETVRLMLEYISFCYKQLV